MRSARSRGSRRRRTMKPIPRAVPSPQGGAGADPGQAQRAQHDAHEVEDGAVDLDPGDGLLGEQGQHRQRRLPPEATVDLEVGPVNCRVRLRPSESR